MENEPLAAIVELIQFSWQLRNDPVQGITPAPNLSCATRIHKGHHSHLLRSRWHMPQREPSRCCWTDKPIFSRPLAA